MSRPLSSHSNFILSLPHDTPVKEVIAKAKAKGLRATESNIYRVRRLRRKPSARRPAAAGRAPRAAAPASGGSRNAEGLLRAVAAEIGLRRAIELLSAERARVRSLLGA